ncbi:MAG: class I SAM-dependent methyltransferase [Chitinophagaceae bacterium]
MNSTFWNERYGEMAFAYGTKPNYFLEKMLPYAQDNQTILFPAEGEGRNAVFAATKGWNTWAFDISDVGKRKAMHLAALNSVTIQYNLANYESFSYPSNSFDVVGLFFTHASPPTFATLCRKVTEVLKPGGILLANLFAVNQLNNNTGGPKQADWLLTTKLIESYFPKFLFTHLNETTVDLQEGKYHNGLASVIEVMAQKPLL